MTTAGAVDRNYTAAADRSSAMLGAMGILPWVGIILTAVSLAPVSAADFDSAYTDINLDECKVARESGYHAEWACVGYKGIPVHIADHHLHFSISYGFGAEDERAASQTPPAYNYLGLKIEWRLSNASGAWKPAATIVRYFVDKDAGVSLGQVLVVTQLGEGQTCHMAYIDALAHPDANVLARDAADRMAGHFDCSIEPELVGRFEAWP